MSISRFTPPSTVVPLYRSTGQRQQVMTRWFFRHYGTTEQRYCWVTQRHKDATTQEEVTRLTTKTCVALALALAWLCGCQRTVEERLATLGAKPGEVATLRETTFDQTIAEGVTLVDFWADWCTPCNKQSEILDGLARAMSNQAVVARFDIETSKKRVKQFKLEYLPTLILFKDGKPLQTYTGLTERVILELAVGSRLR